ncbi:hypothetical protein R6Q59_006915 [Mikania micrantha]
MAGRRLREAVKEVMTTSGDKDDNNLHGASTLYGPHTLNAYIQEFKKLASSLINNRPVEAGPQPPDLLEKQISLLTPVVMDAHLWVQALVIGDMVTVTFWSACPRNDLMTEGTYALVEMFVQSTNNWEAAYDDDDWCLKFKWSRPSKLSTRSHATIEWQIPDEAVSGVYRITHFGASKSHFGA